VDVVKNAGVIGKIISGVHFGYKVFFGNEKDANKLYVQFYPTLKATIQAYGRSSQEAEQLLTGLASLSPAGAKRRNFTRRYVNAPEGWKRLPKDPKDIPYGYWY
jgi:hypothetical protein